MVMSPHPDPHLVEMFRGMRRGDDPTPTELAETFVITIPFDGAGSLPSVNSKYVIDLGLLKAKITGAVIVADAVGSATIDLRHGTLSDLPTLAPIYGSTAALPTLTTAASAVLDISTWTKYLQPADQLIATLKTRSGSLSSVTLSLHCRRLKWTAGGLTAIDSAGNTVVDSNGNTVTQRD